MVSCSFLFVVSLQKWLVHVCLQETMDKCTERNFSLESEKLRYKIMRLRIQGYRCKSVIAIFAQRVTFTLTVPLTMTILSIHFNQATNRIKNYSNLSQHLVLETNDNSAIANIRNFTLLSKISSSVLPYTCWNLQLLNSIVKKIKDIYSQFYASLIDNSYYFLSWKNYNRVIFNIKHNLYFSFTILKI